MTTEDIGKLTDSDSCVKPRLVPRLWMLNGLLALAIVVMWWAI